ncbi:MAG: hypothetical protein IJ083_08370 [Clostridia bacterium]|nr:hypothetical protein [Clostridia bacterium]
MQKYKERKTKSELVIGAAFVAVREIIMVGEKIGCSGKVRDSGIGCRFSPHPACRPGRHGLWAALMTHE